MEKYILKWHSHTPNVLSEIQQMLTRKLFTDVTIVSEGQSLQAHRLILSACSPYFKNMLAQNPCKHPIILMTGTPRIIQKIVDFMYKGEIIVDRKDMVELLKLSEIMQIRGLPEICKQQLNLNQTGAATQPAFIPSFVPVVGPGGNTTILNAPNYHTPIGQSPSQPPIETIEVDHDSSDTLDTELPLLTPESPSIVERPADKNKFTAPQLFDVLSKQSRWEVLTPDPHSNDTILRYQSPHSTPHSLSESTSRLDSSFSSALEETATPKLKLQVQPLQLIELNLDKLVDLKQKITERMSASKKEIPTPVVIQPPLKPHTQIEYPPPKKPRKTPSKSGPYQPRQKHPYLECYDRVEPKRKSTEKTKIRSRASPAWNFFSWKEGWFAICDICNAKVSYKRSLYLPKHLDESHPEVDWRTSVKPSKPQKTEDATGPLEGSTSQSSISEPSTSTMKPNESAVSEQSESFILDSNAQSGLESTDVPQITIRSKLQSEIESPVLDYEMEEAAEVPGVQYDEITVQVSSLPSVGDVPDDSVTLEKAESSQNG